MFKIKITRGGNYEILNHIHEKLLATHDTALCINIKTIILIIQKQN